MANKTDDSAKAPKSKKDPEGLHEGHRERLKKRFLDANSFEGFEEHQILELILFYSIPRIDTNEIAHVLLNKFGSLSGVFDADYEELVKIKGISMNSATLLKMIPRLIPVYYNSRNKDTVYNDSKRITDMFKAHLTGLDHEELWVACFNGKLELITCQLVSKGVVNGADVQTRRLMEIVMKAKAVSIAVAHNHPKGNAVPSSEDMAFTRDIKRDMERVQVSLLDHIIIGDNDTHSLRLSPYMFWE
ncbi:MAG: RadC family protein [Oscillospiraceae bacterium]|nr:RadC family protein [Oscillospiraceae bacterium]